MTQSGRLVIDYRRIPFVLWLNYIN